MISTRNSKRRVLALAVSAFALLLGAGTASASAHSAWWQLDSTGVTNFAPGQKAIILDNAINGGYTTASGESTPIVITAKLPAHLKVLTAEGEAGIYAPFGSQKPIPISCPISEGGSLVTCKLEGAGSLVLPSEGIKLKLEVEGEAGLEEGALTTFKIEGGKDGSGQGMAIRTYERHLKVSAEDAKFGLSRFEMRPENAEGELETQAGAHPFQFSSIVDFNEKPEETVYFGGSVHLNPVPPALAKNLHFILPPGLIGNVNNRPQCTEADFDTLTNGRTNLCKQDTAIGVATATLLEPNALGLANVSAPIFNLVPSPGEPARFGFEFYRVPVVLTTRVLSGSSYAVEVSVHYASEAANVEGTEVTFWGAPGDRRHDTSRGWECLFEGAQVSSLPGKHVCAEPEEAEHPSALLTMPTSCEGTPTTTANGEAWSGATFGGAASDEWQFTPFTNCAALPFSPTVEVESDTSSAATPSGMTVRVKVPQDTTLSGEEGSLAEAAIRKTTLTLPSGVMASAGAANDLQTCTSSQFGLIGGVEELKPLTENDHFNTNAVECPDASKVGTVKIKTPLLEHELEGSVYLAHLNTSPFESPLVLFIFASDEASGVQVKLAGEVKPNPATGELTSVFEETPPVAFSELNLHLMGGPRASQSTPETCGVHEGSASFESWAMAHHTPEPYVAPNPALNITSEPGGGACESSPTSQPFAPGFVAGSASTQGGAFSPFIVNIERPDGQQALKSIAVHLPLGAAAMLASVTPCTMEQVHADACPASSLVGHSTAVAGFGSSNVTIPGEVFLTASPSPGVPFGLLAVSNAEHVGVSAAEPNGVFNLGRIPVLSGITVNPTTAQATVTSEPLPQFVKGVPAQIKRLSVVVDREHFTFNPTNCEALATTGTLAGYGPAGSEGTEAVSTPYHATGCGSLPFSPTISVNVESNYSRTEGTGMKVKLTARPGDANIKLTKLVFPGNVPSRLTTIQKACKVQVFEANPAGCPEGSVIGTAVAHTPVLKSPLTGPAYLVSHANESFPDAVFILQGEGIKLILDGKTNIKVINSEESITSSTFSTVPDAPVETFEVSLPRGPHSAFSGYGDLCAKPIKVPTTFGGQNGALIETETKVTVEGCGGVKPHKTESELAKLLKKCQKAKKKLRAKCNANAHKQASAVATCKKRTKKGSKKQSKCIAQARKKYALKLK